MIILWNAQGFIERSKSCMHIQFECYRLNGYLIDFPYPIESAFKLLRGTNASIQQIMNKTSNTMLRQTTDDFEWHNVLSFLAPFFKYTYIHIHIYIFQNTRRSSTDKYIHNKSRSNVTNHCFPANRAESDSNTRSLMQTNETFSFLIK